ncbi:hypothetical protein Lal_00032011 [Lupinus albus]|nr:hypothetical protein Lal_00032011 [Lupinus albus]
MQGVNTFVEMDRTIYPPLIREFYSNFQCKNEVFLTMIKGKFIVLNEELLMEVGGFKCFEYQYGTFERKMMNSFEPVNVYRSLLRNIDHCDARSKPHATSLAVEYRLMYILIAYSLVPRDADHDNPTTEDLRLMSAIKEGMKINWPLVVLLTMLYIASSSS